ncbi:MAG TPA: S41 family peptidase [Actinokineospora sp.]|nr:S41 family peptidase [Actinokineospora sp.]
MTASGRGYLRYPTVHRDTVVFACEDDLWAVAATGGPARRLTTCASEACHPRLSPDGSQVAFAAAEDGHTEVYVQPMAGGPARRLTFQAATRCVVVTWHPDTGEVVYASTAEQAAGFGFRLFAVAASGSAPRLLDPGAATALSFGPNGGVVLGRSNADPARWKRYRGGAAGDLWIDASGGGRFTRLLDLPGNLAGPCWVGDRIYFVSDHEGTGNVYSCLTDGTDLRGHTEHADFYARNLSTDGTQLVYHAGARLFRLDPATGDAAEIPVELVSARAQRQRRFARAADHLEDARVSPDGTRLAVLARGKAFTFDHWAGPVRDHGQAVGVRYRLPRWLADGTRLVAVAGDDQPTERLVLLDAEGGTAETDLHIGDLGCVTELVASPVSGLVAFTTNRQQLWVLNTEDERPLPTLLDASPFERIEDLTWSPDGRWVAYTYPNTPRTSAIKVAEVAIARAFQVTEPVLRDSRPAFDPGGRYLYFIGQRDVTPRLDQVEAAVGFPFGARPYLVPLRAHEVSPFVPRPHAPGTDTAVEPRADGAAVDIDLVDIDRRVVAFPVPEGRYASVLGLPGRVLLLTVPADDPDDEPDGSATMVDLGTGEVTADFLSPVDEFDVNADASALLYRADKQLRVVAAGADKDAVDEHDEPDSPGGRTGWVDLDRVTVAVHPAAEWRQMFREAWRLQRECFWNAEMSGVDWAAMYERYAPLAELVASRTELSDLMWELQGELGTSHAYERGGDHRVAGRHKQGFLGLDWAGAEPGTWRVARVLRGDPWRKDATSPCNRPGTDIRPGDAITAVNGTLVGAAGPGELLVGRADHEVELTVDRPGATPRRVAVSAIATEDRARYLDWVAANRRYVRAASDGRLGYLHVPDMFPAGYADFVRGFLTELDSPGLIVDVRFNGGGHVSPLLLDRLARRRSGVEHGRWSGAAPYPLEAPRGPMVALINEQTGSDGEIFSHMFRVTGLGSLIGTRTWGGVIATWPRHHLVDGTVTTQPEFRYLLREAGGSLENAGVAPDIEIPIPPGGPAVDPQLAAAVAHMLPTLAGDPVRAARIGASHSA